MENITDFLHELCDLAARETLPRFRAGTDIANKQSRGFDPVTEGDQAAERAIRDRIAQKYPDHGIIGEEYGLAHAGAEYQWIIDPIDGTRAFISGLPVWGTLIGLYRDGVPLAGIMDQPFTGERYFANGQASFLRLRGQGEDRQIATSTTEQLSEATLMTTSPHLFLNEEHEAYSALESRVMMARYGCDCYAYCMVASGHVDLVVESGLNVYDIAALIPVIERAGGIVSAWDGGSAAQGGQIVAAANVGLHEAAIGILRQAAA